ncbi:uncharacterized protein LOC127725979 [Mytilus californianus]|uniref:uncharacterized protein LOC127725979 n=1 Tax=Mytilus californianus TaxID=6549 RepID=UPI00224638CF|nr:uncharacterized protein LOC127725979 [Mytilus californianus]
MQEDTSDGTILIRPKLLIVSLGLPAKAIVSNMKQFNGKSSCSLCLDKGTQRPDHPMLRFNLFNTDSGIRTHQSMVNDAMLLGVTKARMKLWSDAKKKDRRFFVGNQITLLDKRFLKIKIPDFVSIADPTNWKDVASKLPVKEKSKIVTFSAVSLVEGIMSEVPMFTVMDETEKETKLKKVNDDEKPDIHEEISVNSSSFSSEANEMNDSLPLLINCFVDSLSINDSVEPLSVNDFVDPLLINDSVEHLSINDSVEPLPIIDSVVSLSNYESVEPLSINDFVEPLLIDDFEENQDGGFTTNGNILQLCTETSIRRVLEVDSNVSQIGHCTGQSDKNSIRDNKVWSNPDYHIMPVTKNGDVYSSDKLSQGYDSNKSEKSNISAISSGCCSTNSYQQGVQICRCGFTVSAHKYSTELSKHPKSSSFSDDFLPFHIHFEESMFSSKGVIDLQKEQANKSINIKYSDGEEYLKKCRKHHEIAKIVKTTLIELVRKRVTKINPALQCNRMNKKRRISRRRLRRIIFSNRIKSPRSLQIQVRPVQNSPQLRTTSDEVNTSHSNQNGTTLSLQQQNSVQSVLSVHNISTYIRPDGSSDLVSELSFTTPSVASPSSWTNYFNRLSMGYEYSLEEKMQYEWLRVQSFQDFPATCHTSPLRLARAGFFSTGINDEVKCFSCGVKYKNWKQRDNPIEVHHRISLDCRMVNGRETTNIPIISEINGAAADNPQQESSQSLLTDDFLPSTIHQNEDLSIQTTEGAQNRSLKREDIQSSNVADTNTQLINQTLQPQVVQDAMRQPVVDRDHSVLDGEQNRTEDKSKAEDLSISLETPKHQAYAQLNDRVSTFQGWPGYLEQAPRDMALAGFFYEGYNDYCRCFFCGGGLRNWEAGDDPWVEHARFVKQNRGHRLVEIITQRQAEMQASNNSSDIAENQTEESNQSENEDRTQINSQETSATPMITQLDFLRSTIHQNEDLSIQTTEGAQNRSLTRGDIQSSNVADTNSQLINQTLQPHVVQDAMRQPVVDRDHSVLDGEQNRTEDKSKAEDLSISLETPKHQAYAQLNDRVSTFQGWPGYLEQAPRDMALAGFFYEGYNDYCRCFFCGGGLRNWEAGDDPWVEHARWFSKCAFVRQNRGHRFVEIITNRQAEMVNTIS